MGDGGPPGDAGESAPGNQRMASGENVPEDGHHPAPRLEGDSGSNNSRRHRRFKKSADQGAAS
jgi:hypothetical protein